MERETTTTTVYDNHEPRRVMAPAQIAPVGLVSSNSKYSDVKARGCLNTCATLQILLGLAIVGLEAACVGLYYYLEESAVGIWVGIFAVITGIVGLIAGRRKRSGGIRRCLFITELIVTLLCALKAFALFCASAALLALAVSYYYNVRNQYGGSPGYGGYNLQGYQGYYAGAGVSGNSYYFSQNLENVIGLKATLMILYLILFVVAIIASALSCVNCCRRSPKQQVVMTVYPAGQPAVVQQHKV